MGFWTLKQTTSECHQHFTGGCPTSPTSYSAEIFQISQPPSPQKFTKWGGVGGFLDPKTDHLRISPKFYWRFFHISPILFHWNFSNISPHLPPTPSQRGVGWVKFHEKIDQIRISPKSYWRFSHISPIIFRWNFSNISLPL